MPHAGDELGGRWTIKYYGLAIESMRRAGRHVEDDVLAHSENINFFGVIEVDVDGELAQLGPTGYRPLRPRHPVLRRRGLCSEQR